MINRRVDRVLQRLSPSPELQLMQTDMLSHCVDSVVRILSRTNWLKWNIEHSDLLAGVSCVEVVQNLVMIHGCSINGSDWESSKHILPDLQSGSNHHSDWLEICAGDFTSHNHVKRMWRHWTDEGSAEIWAWAPQYWQYCSCVYEKSCGSLMQCRAEVMSFMSCLWAQGEERQRRSWENWSWTATLGVLRWDDVPLQPCRSKNLQMDSTQDLVRPSKHWINN